MQDHRFAESMLRPSMCSGMKGTFCVCTKLVAVNIRADGRSWNSGVLCCLSSDSAFFVLKCDKDAINLYLEQGLNEEDGCEAAFEPIYEVHLLLCTELH